MTAYYSENDPKAAAWLRELIRQGLIAKGEVDERSIVDVRPSELKGFTQCHFFAGIGVWSYALRRAGWTDNTPAWTGSCPCQPFSEAGEGRGFDDERHLWPHFHWLIDQCRPERIFGEQVASKDGLGWLDLVQADLEGSGYASGAVDTCSAGFGAPHIRQRIWWVAERLADCDDKRLEGRRESGRGCSAEFTAGASGLACRLVDANGGDAGAEREQCGREQRQQQGDSGAVIRLADAERSERPTGRRGDIGQESSEFEIGVDADRCGKISRTYDLAGAAGPTNGIWRDADWLLCRDGKWRPVEPGTFPLAHGAPARVGRLRGYGNAINAEAATAFIEAYLEAGAIAA